MNRNHVEVIHNNLTDTLKSRSWKLKHSSGCESSAIERDGCSQLAMVMTYISYFPEILHCATVSLLITTDGINNTYGSPLR